MTQARETKEFDLYFDESGTFLETSDLPDERARAKEFKQFPSQLAGFVVPRGDIKGEAEKIITACKKAGLLRPEETFKGSDLHGKRMSRFVRQLIVEFKTRPLWQPARIVNQEAVSYGGQVAAYTNLFAELILRILHQKSNEEPEANILVSAFGTTLMRDGRDGIKRPDYLNRVSEYLKFLAVRRGLAPESSRWTLDGLVLNFGAKRPELLICDILSNASHDDFRKLDFQKPRHRSPTSELLITTFAERNWTLTVRELFERVAILVEECSFGMALIAIAETIAPDDTPDTIPEDYDPLFIEKAKTAIEDIINRLAGMGARGRDPQLATILNWLDQVIGHQRLTARGYHLAQWLLTNIARPLCDALKDERQHETVSWFEYGLRRWALTAANHQGKLFEAETEAKAMRPIAQRLARQWERAPILFDGLISQAVHLTDSFEFARVSEDMRLVAKSLETQSSLFSDYLGAQFPDPITFDLRAKAIGTLVQSEVLRGFSDERHLNETRSLSDGAIAEFVDANDKARQYQYRCHLETIGGDFASARKYLIWSMRQGSTAGSDSSHVAIQSMLSEAGDELRWPRDFTISHWLRLGARICLLDDPEREEFLYAFDRSGLGRYYVGSTGLTSYPIHTIMRSIAVIQASRGRVDSALSALDRLHDLDPIGKTQFVLAMVLLAAQAEVAALLWKRVPQKARGLLFDVIGSPPSLTHLFSRMSAAQVDQLPRIAELINSWQSRIDALVTVGLPSEAAIDLLLAIGSEVRY